MQQLLEVTPIAQRRYPYRAKTAYRLALYAAEAYQSEPIIKAKYGRRFHSFLIGEYHSRFGLKIADTQAFILKYRHRHGSHMILAFRGTEGLFRKPADWLTNLDLALTTVDLLPSLKEGQPMVHRGFLRAYESIRPGLITAFTEIEPGHVYVTGHSLGGALAILAALDIRMQFPGINVAMYNFGSPRVGDPLFADVYDKLVRNSYRVVHDGDRSPEQPHEGYQHVGKLHVLDRHPDSRYPHHKCEYYLEQLDKEISQTGVGSAA